MGDIEEKIGRVMRGELLTEQECVSLCESVKAVLRKEPTVVAVRVPVTIVSDIHGQFADLLEILKVAGSPPETNLLFLGDYVDRGYRSLQVISLIFLLKLRWRDSVTVLRGNHETRSVSTVYGFIDNCRQAYGSPVVWQAFTDTFDFLPLTSVVENQIFSLHGGLSPSVDRVYPLEGQTTAESTGETRQVSIMELDRFQEVPHDGAITDICWSDPDDRCGWGISPRGAGYTFGADITAAFLRTNNLKLIVRGHQLVMEGYSWTHERQVVTLFSAPNYCYRCGNLAAVMEIDEHMKYTFLTFEAAPGQDGPSDRALLESGNIRKLPDHFL